MLPSVQTRTAVGRNSLCPVARVSVRSTVCEYDRDLVDRVAADGKAEDQAAGEKCAGGGASTETAEPSMVDVHEAR